MEISERKKQILRAVVEGYVATAEPVGSKAIAQESGLGLSSATIRNEMAELESMGLLEQPHTSAGRIPSALGYRVYVNELMHRQQLPEEETAEIQRNLQPGSGRADKVLSDAGRLTSRLTNYPAYALATAPAAVTISRFDLIHIDANTFIVVVLLSNSTVQNKLIRLPITVEQAMLTKLSTVFNASFTNLPEDRITRQVISAAERAAGDTQGLVAAIAGFAIETLAETQASAAFVSGTSNLLRFPEYQDVGKAQRIMNYLSDSSALLKLPTPESDRDVKITIGPENLAEELKDSSVIVAKYNAGDSLQGLIGVVGPTRMDYSKVAARLAYIANGLSWLLSGGAVEPPMLDGGKDPDGKR